MKFGDLICVATRSTWVVQCVTPYTLQQVRRAAAKNIKATEYLMNSY